LSEHTSPSGEPIVIKKYANRRLYNTSTSAYVTLEDLADMVKRGRDFTVHDAKTGDDITRQVLTQIIFEEENKGQNLMPIKFLRQLIRFYGDQMQAFVPSYLEMSLEQLTREQQTLRNQLLNTMGVSAEPFRVIDDQVKKNMAMFEDAMRFFQPFAQKDARDERPQNASTRSSSGSATASDLKAMQDQLKEMQRKLDSLTGKNS
jgi:polyhydroxyalkanoate synthesis repressor PhaR